MTRKYLLGAAAVALFAATGAARAADVMPIVVSVTPTLPPVTVGPTVTVQLDTGTYGYWTPGFFYTGVYVSGEIDVKTAAGWGFNLIGYGGLDILPPPIGPYYYGLRAELYRIIGNAQVGFFVSPYNFVPLDIEFGPTFRYETDRFEYAHETEINYNGAWQIEFDNDITVHVNDRLDIEGYFDFSFSGAYLYFGIYAELEVNDRLTLEGWADAYVSGGFGAGVGGRAQLDFGPLSPFVGANWYSMGGVGVFAGVELEHQIGTGPFTLIGDAGVNWNPGGPPGFYASIGIRFNRGDKNNLLFSDDS
ncbi:MAG: hypothetical protein KIS68_03370 [Bauldia sp.]|nr:hypothetical protein [Bauldia sp.]